MSKSKFVKQMALHAVEYVNEDGKRAETATGFPFEVDSDQVAFLQSVGASRDLTESEIMIEEARAARAAKSADLGAPKTSVAEEAALQAAREKAAEDAAQAAKDAAEAEQAGKNDTTGEGGGKETVETSGTKPEDSGKAGRRTPGRSADV